METTSNDELALRLQAANWKPRLLPGFMGTAGPLWTQREGEGWAYGLLVQAGHLNPAGVAHGGALLTLLDHAISTVAWQASGRLPCMTLQLDTHFLAPVRQGMFVEARASVSHRSHKLVFMRGQLVTGGQPVLDAQAIMKVVGLPAKE
jgi:uncharacterized protein (TIGR00369 family)